MLPKKVKNDHAPENALIESTLTEKEQATFSSKEFLSLKPEFREGIIQAHRQCIAPHTVNSRAILGAPNIAFLSLLLQEIDTRKAFTIDQKLYEDLIYLSFTIYFREEDFSPKIIKACSETIIFLLPLFQKVGLKEWFSQFDVRSHVPDLYMSLHTFLSKVGMGTKDYKIMTSMQEQTFAAIKYESDKVALFEFLMASKDPKSPANTIFDQKKNPLADVQLINHELAPFLEMPRVVQQYNQEFVQRENEKEFKLFIQNATKGLEQFKGCGADLINSIKSLQKIISQDEIKLRVSNLLFVLPYISNPDPYKIRCLTSLMMNINNSLSLNEHKDAKTIINFVHSMITSMNTYEICRLLSSNYSLDDFSTAEKFNAKFTWLTTNNRHSFFNVTSYPNPVQRQNLFEFCNDETKQYIQATIDRVKSTAQDNITLRMNNLALILKCIQKEKALNNTEQAQLIDFVMQLPSSTTLDNPEKTAKLLERTLPHLALLKDIGSLNDIQKEKVMDMLYKADLAGKSYKNAVIVLRLKFKGELNAEAEALSQDKPSMGTRPF